MIRLTLFLVATVATFGIMLGSYWLGLALALCLGLYAIVGILSFVELSA